MPKKPNPCKGIIKSINSKLINIKKGINKLTYKSAKRLAQYHKKVNRLNRTLKNTSTKSKRLIDLEKQTEKSIFKDKKEFISSQCKLIDSISELKKNIIENRCNPSSLKPIHITPKHITTMNMLFTPDEQILLYNDLL
jgi:Na+/phosphate symporter